MAATDPAPMSRAVAVLYAIVSPLTLVALVFVPAGRIDWLPGWVFTGVVTAVFAASAGVLAWVNPAIYRARSRFQPGTESWDVVLAQVILATTVLEVPLATLELRPDVMVGGSALDGNIRVCLAGWRHRRHNLGLGCQPILRAGCAHPTRA